MLLVDHIELLVVRLVTVLVELVSVDGSCCWTNLIIARRSSLPPPIRRFRDGSRAAATRVRFFTAAIVGSTVLPSTL